MSPAEVTEKLQLNKLKDKIWYVVPSCATTGEGLFEGLVSNHCSLIVPMPRVAGHRLTSNAGLALQQRQDAYAANDRHLRMIFCSSSFRA